MEAGPEAAMSVELLRAAALDGTPHGFLGRRGGVSTGVCTGLNVGLGSGDDREAIRENRRRAVEAVAPGARLVTLHQVHSADALVVEAPFPDDKRPPADGMATDRPGLALGILTADCAPILFADEQSGVIAAAHAGWRGALGGIVESTVRQMERLGAERARIAAAVGPCIARRSYEVDDAFFRCFIEADPENERYFESGDRLHHRFDLESYVQSRLAASGVHMAQALGEDTYSQPDRFYSYRRSTHLGEPDYGRQISLIALTG